MSTEINTNTVIEFNQNSLKIHGEPVILLSASLFYFRIPRGYWRERMEQVKAMGYNCIDVYFPWNFHEKNEGLWDFTGERDVEAFLKTAADVGIWVVARPGPYICSEWDGGALPAYLLAKPELILREANSEYLKHVSKWFDRIMPLIRKYQVNEGGTVICVQLDNELDFYDCKDPLSYISALRDMTLAYGINIPLIACAGQGGIIEASGLAEGVVPTCNFYPNDRDPVFEQKVIHYRDTLATMGYPLLVTETNRTHYLLRRLLSVGAKLVGPYLQVSGTDFGFTNATNNWGKPLAFMTSDYDFGGMISPEGHLREEAYEGRMLSRIIKAYGNAITTASYDREHNWKVAVENGKQGVIGPHTLQLNGQGSLAFVTNAEDSAKEIALYSKNGHRIPEAGWLTLAAGRSITLPVDIPLTLWGLSGTLVHSSAELYVVHTETAGATLAFHSEGRGEVILELDAPPQVVEATGLIATNRGTKLIVNFEGKETARVHIVLHDGKHLSLIATNLVNALYTEGFDSAGMLKISKAQLASNKPIAVEVNWELAAFDPSVSLETLSDANRENAYAHADYLERSNIYRGFAWYEASVFVPDAQTVQGIFVRSGSDVISLYAGGEYVTTIAPGGGSRYIPLNSNMKTSKLAARIEIWGHTNFDDARLPGLRLNSMKGIKGMAAVTTCLDLTGNWKSYRVKDQDQTLKHDLINPKDDSFWPVVSFGNWLSPDHPSHEYFRQSFQSSKDANSWTIHFKGIQSLARLFVNGQDAGMVQPFDPYMDITPYVVPGEEVKLTVYLERVLGLPAGEVFVYEASEAADWRLTSAEEDELLVHAASIETSALTQDLPLSLEPGTIAWLYGKVNQSPNSNGFRVQVNGSNVKLSVLFEGQLVSRLWLSGGEERPTVTGGSQDSFYLPGVWFGNQVWSLVILLEAVNIAVPGRIESFTFLTV